MKASTSEEARHAWSKARLSPLWESPNAHKPPAKPAAACMWAWETLRPLLDLAFQETSPAIAERRVLQLMSPLSRSVADEFTVGNVLAAIQCLLPGETARPHRHSMTALRFMLEGTGAETIVNGKVCKMEFGDLILTPAWCWHEHRHLGTEPVLWLDALDVPLHAYLGTGEFQRPPIATMPVTMQDISFSIPNILPEEIKVTGDHSPVFRYPYADAVAALSNAPPSPDLTRRVRYVNPVNGDTATPLLDSFMIQVERGETRPMRTSANSVCVVAEGRGETRIGDQTFSWGPRDIFTLPQWNWIVHSTTDQNARLFVVSDREVLKKLGLYREDVQTTSS